MQDQPVLSKEKVGQHYMVTVIISQPFQPSMVKAMEKGPQLSPQDTAKSYVQDLP